VFGGKALQHPPVKLALHRHLAGDRARKPPGDRDAVADLDRVLNQHKYAGDDVTHQGLRAEPDRDADDAGVGEERGDDDSDFAQRSGVALRPGGDELRPLTLSKE
jgi:hypothetical protein